MCAWETRWLQSKQPALRQGDPHWWNRDVNIKGKHAAFLNDCVFLLHYWASLPKTLYRILTVFERVNPLENNNWWQICIKLFLLNRNKVDSLECVEYVCTVGVVSEVQPHVCCCPAVWATRLNKLGGGKSRLGDVTSPQTDRLWH